MTDCTNDRIFNGRVVQKLVLSLSLLIAFLIPVGGSSASRTDNPLNVYSGARVFNDPAYDPLVLVEFPLSLRREEFKFIATDSTATKFEARVFARVDLINARGITVDSASTYFALRVDEYRQAQLPGYRIFDQLSLLTKPGDYSARLTVIDDVSKRRGEFFIDRFKVEKPATRQPTVAGISMAYDIRYVGDEKTINPNLTRNGFQVYPNPISIFSTEDTIVYFYHEVYNLFFSETDSKVFDISYEILKSGSGLFRNLGNVIKEKAGSTAAISESFDIRGWSAGLYQLRVTVVDHQTRLADTGLASFKIIQPIETLILASRNSKGDPYHKLTLQEKISLVNYLLTPEQKKVLKSLSGQGKLNYLDLYWSEHDVSSGTLAFENRLRLIEYFESANYYFSTDADDSNGWATDRGRIYMTYGIWDEIDDVTAPRLGNAYVIWYYRSLDEGKLFVFEDWSGNDDYRLVHSNVYKEVYSQQWQDLINQGPRLEIE